MNNLIYGIDFGTTNSAVTIFNNGKAVNVPMEEDGGSILRSVLFFPDNSEKIHIGEEAVKRYVRSGMKGRFIQSVKTFLPDSLFEKTYVRDRWYMLEELISLILTEMKHRSDEYCGEEVTSVVIGRPAVFSEDEENELLAVKRLRSAAKQAGFREIHFQIESSAAALLYEQELTAPELVLVVDSGGGTTDFTLMRLSPERTGMKDRKSDILGSAGLYVAGDKFNSLIMWYKLVKYFGSEVQWKSWDKWIAMPARLMRTLCEWRKIPFLKSRDEMENIAEILKHADDKKAVRRLQTLIEKNLGFSVFQAIEKAKCELSEADRDVISYHRLKIDIEEPISRKEFEDIISEEVDKISDELKRLLQNTGVKAGEIGSVFTTGGSSQVPLMRKTLGEWFGADKLKSGDAYLSVSRGLALSAPLYFDNISK